MRLIRWDVKRIFQRYRLTRNERSWYHEPMSNPYQDLFDPEQDDEQDDETLVRMGLAIPLKARAVKYRATGFTLRAQKLNKSKEG